jgi:hypothetical protein
MIDKNKCNSKLINLFENECNQKVEKDILLKKDHKRHQKKLIKGSQDNEKEYEHLLEYFFFS